MQNSNVNDKENYQSRLSNVKQSPRMTILDDNYTPQFLAKSSPLKTPKSKDNTNTVSTSGFVLRDITNDETQTKKHTLSSISKKSHRDEDFVRIKRSKLAIVHTAIPATIVTHDVILPDIEYMPPSGSLQPSTAKDYLDIIPIEQDMTSLLYPPLVSGAILNDNDQDTETIHIQEYTKDFAIPFIGLDHERKDGDDPDIPSLWIE